VSAVQRPHNYVLPVGRLTVNTRHSADRAIGIVNTVMKYLFIIIDNIINIYRILSNLKKKKTIKTDIILIARERRFRFFDALRSSFTSTTNETKNASDPFITSVVCVRVIVYLF